MSETPARPVKLGVIGGSGLYDIEGLEDTEWCHVESPFGAPSDDVLCGRLNGLDIAFLPRHGRGHTQSPSTINFRANIDVLKRLGVTDIISLSAVGSLQDELEPGDFLIVDQFIDRTFSREKSFFGAGLVAHVSMARPVCTRLGDCIGEAATAAAAEITIKRGGTYMVMEGPQFSSLAESELYRSWGCSVIGMTNMPEAKLAREAEMCYATVAMVTDYDCWHPHHEDVTVDAVIAAVHANAATARALVKHLAGTIEHSRTTCAHGCDTALEYAVITAPDARDPAMMKKLDAVAGRIIG